MDIIKTDLVIGESAAPGTGRLLVGGIEATDATPIVQILHGTASIDLPSITTFTTGTASAAVVGMTTAFNVICMPQAWAAADVTVVLSGAVGIAGGFQVTGSNIRTATTDATAQTVQYFAWR